MPRVPYNINDFEIGEGPDPNGFLPFSGRVKKTDVATEERRQIYEEQLAANALSGQAALFESANAAAEAANAIAARKKEEAAKLANHAYNSKPPPRIRRTFDTTRVQSTETPATAAEAATATPVDPVLAQKIMDFNRKIKEKETVITNADTKKKLSDIEDNINKIRKQIYAVFDNKPGNKTEKDTLLARTREVIEKVKIKMGGLVRGGTRKHRKNLRKTRKNHR
jgi:hypothetical protein